MLIARYFEFLRKLYKEQPEKITVTRAEVQADLELDTTETSILGSLIQIGHLWSRSATGGEAWSVGVFQEVENFPPDGDLSEQVERVALRDYDAERPVFLEERHKLQYAGARLRVSEIEKDSLAVP